MINDKSSVPVTNEAYDDKNHEDDISSDGRHGVCEGRGKLISGRGTTGVYWRSGRLVFQMSPDDSAAHAKIARQMLLKGVH